MPHANCGCRETTHALFKCQECKQIFGQDLKTYGLYVTHCPFCKHDYMDGQNLEECLQTLADLDKQCHTKI